MNIAQKVKANRKAVNLSIDEQMLADARELGLNISKIAETGLDQAIRQAKGEKWKEENREAMEASNAWVKKNGLPLAKYRRF